MAASLNPYITQFDVTFDAEKSLNYRMTIQLALGGFSFAILDTISHTIVAIEFYQSDNLYDSQELIDTIERALEKHGLRSCSFKSVVCIIDDRINVLVPTSLFDESKSDKYLNFSFQPQESHKILTERIADASCVNVFAMPMSLYSKMANQWKNVKFTHASTIFIQSLVGTSTTHPTNAFVQVKNRNFDLAITQNGKLSFFNNYRFTTKEDFIYFLLFAFEQNELSGTEVPIHFSGLILPASDIVELCGRYIKDIKFVGSDMVLKVGDALSEIPFQYYYIHYQTLKCES